MMTEKPKKPKAQGASSAGKRKSATRSPRKEAAPQKGGAKGKAGPEANRAAAKGASRQIDERIRSLGGWRAETLAEVRRLIHEADPEIAEEVKWIKPTNPLGVPVWSHAGIVCTGEAYKEVIKLTFARGASLKDPRGLFNSSHDGNTRRAIDIREGESVDAEALRALIRAAVAENVRASSRKSQHTKRPSPAKAIASAQPTKVKKGKNVVLLSGGNPQIAKADGEAPVQAYIAAIPGWKREIGRRLDALIVRTVPGVRKAVKWNSPFYGLEGQGWFVSFHVFTHYVKVTFFRGTSLVPIPPGGTGKDARWIDVHEDDLDEALLANWLKQAAALPGWDPSRPS
jgi:hypothetical protein